MNTVRKASQKKPLSSRGNRTCLCCIWDSSARGRSLRKHVSDMVVLFMTGPLTHCFLDNMASIDLLVLVHLFECGEDIVSSIGLPPEVGTHQRTI